MPHGFQSHLHQQFLQPVTLLFRRQRQSLQHRKQIFFASQLTKNRGFLRKVTDAATGPQVHGEVRDFIAVEKNPAGVGAGKTNYDVEGCCLSCAIRSQEPNDFTLSDLQLHIVHDLASAIRLAQLDGLELQHPSSFLDSVLRQSARTIFRVDDDRIIR